MPSPRLRKQTQEREVKRHARGARKKLRKATLRTPGLGQNMRDRRNLLVFTAGICVAIWVTSPTVWLYLFPAYIVLILGQLALNRAFKQGGDYMMAMHLRAQLQMMDAVCEATEEELAPDHPERVAAHNHRKELRRAYREAVREYR